MLYPVVILAGGLATRLRPVTETIPKALVDINGEPFIAHQLRLLQENGIREVVMCLGYLGEQIVNYVGNGNKFGLHVSYVFDGPQLLGTAGAIKNAVLNLPEHFFVINGDSYLPCNYQAVQNAFDKSGKAALMTVYKNNGMWDSSNVEFSDGEILVYDKKNKTERMLYIDYGLEVFSKHVFQSVPENQPCDLEPVYQDLIKNNQLAACEVHQRFYENGSFSGIKELERYLDTSCATSP